MATLLMGDAEEVKTFNAVWPKLRMGNADSTNLQLALPQDAPAIAEIERKKGISTFSGQNKCTYPLFLGRSNA